MTALRSLSRDFLQKQEEAEASWTFSPGGRAQVPSLPQLFLQPAYCLLGPAALLCSERHKANPSFMQTPAPLYDQDGG